MAAGLRSLFLSVHNLAQCLLLTKNMSLEKWVLASQHFPTVREKTREQRWKIPAMSCPVVALCLGPGESGCATRAEVALVVTWDWRERGSQRSGMALCLLSCWLENPMSGFSSLNSLRTLLGAEPWGSPWVSGGCSDWGCWAGLG